MTRTGASDVGGVVRAPERRRRVSPWLAWLVVAPFPAWAVARLAGLDRVPLLVEAMAVTPYAAVGSLIALLVAAAARVRGAIAVGLATVLTMAAMVVPRALPSAPAATGPALKVLTANLFFGHADAPAVVALVRRLRPDVLSLQELTPRALAALDAAGLGELLPYRHTEEGWGASGGGIFSRYPLTEQPGFSPGGGHAMPRARFTLPTGQAVEIVNVHTVAPLGPAVADWRAQLAALPRPEPGVIRVLAGDFNATLDHADLRRVLAAGYADAADATGTGLVPTWPSGRRLPPLITIDHVLYDRRASAVRTEVHTLPFTDHRAFFAELRLPGR